MVTRSRVRFIVLSFPGVVFASLLAAGCGDSPVDADAPPAASAAASASDELRDESARSSSVCYRHVLPTSRNLCLQAFDLGTEQGMSEDVVTEDVKACGFINWPSTIQDCLRDLIVSYGGTPDR
jgi:hypothetical protein